MQASVAVAPAHWTLLPHTQTSFVRKYFVRVLDKSLDEIWVSHLCCQTCKILARHELGEDLVKPTYLTDEDNPRESESERERAQGFLKSLSDGRAETRTLVLRPRSTVSEHH